MVSGAISLILCLILGAVAVVGAREIRWKILNFLILCVLMTLGLLLGYVVGLWTNNMALGAHITLLLRAASVHFYVSSGIRRETGRGLLDLWPIPFCCLRYRGSRLTHFVVSN